MTPQRIRQHRDKIANRQLLLDPESYASTLLLITLDTLDDEDDETPGLAVLNWHPATVLAEVQNAYNIQLPPRNFDRLMAGITVLTSDAFFTDVRRFIHLSNVLAFDSFDPDLFERASVQECAWAINEALMLSPPDDGNPQPFSPDICAYVRTILSEEGFLYPPDVLASLANSKEFETFQGNYAMDPEMFQGATEMQLTRSRDVERMLAQNFEEMAGQFERMRLANGNAEAWAKALRDIAAEKAQAAHGHSLNEGAYLL